MREIKFRAWLKTRKQMVEVDKIEFLNYEGSTLHLIIHYERDAQTYAAFPGCYELMQFTGSRDRNGKEIYEGDIVKNSFGSLYIIRWVDCMMGFKGEPLNVKNEVSDVEASELEVMGNIYENKELLGSRE